MAYSPLVRRLPTWIRRFLARQLPSPKIQVVPASAVLQAPSAMAVAATAGVDLAGLWAAYQTLQAQAYAAADLYWETVRAGGRAWASTQFSIAYQLQVEAGDAWAAWANAYARVNPAPPPGPQLPSLGG